PEFKKPGRTLSLVKVARDDDQLPDFGNLRQVAAELHELNATGKILSMKALGSGGLMHAVATSAFGNRIGATITADLQPYAERYFCFLVEHDGELPASLFARVLGETVAEPVISFPGESHDLDTLLSAWQGTLEPVYPTKE